MTINDLYVFVKFMANKEQRGFVTTTEFNLLAERAQLDIIQDRYGKYTIPGAAQTAGYNQTHSALEDIRTAVSTFTSVYQANGHWFYPVDNTGASSPNSTMLYFMELSLDGRNVEILTQDQLKGRLGSHLLPPSIDKPVATMNDNGFKIWISPDINNDVSVGDVVCTYIKIPSSPVWAFSTIANGNAVYNATNSNQLTLPEHTHNEIAQRILSYIGISLREPEVQQYSAVKTKDKELQ